MTGCAVCGLAIEEPRLLDRSARSSPRSPSATVTLDHDAYHARHTHQSYRPTYAQLWREVDAAARGLMARGVGKGDRVGILNTAATANDDQQTPAR